VDAKARYIREGQTNGTHQCSDDLDSVQLSIQYDIKIDINR